MKIKYYLRILYYWFFIHNKKKYKLNYKKLFKKKLDNTETINLEKYIWNMKIKWSSILNYKIASKLGAREYVSKKVGDEYLIPLIKIFKKSKNLDFKNIPVNTVIKSNFFCGDKEFIIDKIDDNRNQILINKFKKLMNDNYFFHTGEKWYMPMKKYLLVEKMMDNIQDLKIFMCGKRNLFYLRVMFYDLNIFANFDTNLNFINCIDLKSFQRYTKEYLYSKKNVNKILEKVKKQLPIINFLLDKLYVDKTVIRIDFLLTDTNTYVGEFTLADSNGYDTSNSNEESIIKIINAVHTEVPYKFPKFKSGKYK